MPFEEFLNVRRRVDPHPRLGVQSKGRLSLNESALEALGNPSHIVLLFDPESLSLGVRGAAPKEGHAYRLTSTGKKSETRTVSLVALLNHYQIDGDRYVGSYRGELVDDNMLVIQLRDAHFSEPDDSNPFSNSVSEDDIPF